MKALSLTQPWASLVAIGAKQYETRSWQVALGPYGFQIAIHASKGFPWEAKALMRREPFRAALLPHGYKVPATLPLGAIVAVATVLKLWRTSDLVRGLSEQERAFGDWTPGRFAWQLGNVRRLPEPIPCKGALGFWEVPADVEAEIRRQLAEVSCG